MSNEEIANLIFPNINKTMEYYEKLYPSRDLEKDVIVTRYAPSPTGFIHIGALLAAFVESAFAHQTKGVVYLRIEDTDTKRTVNNGINTIINGLKEFDISFDEGPIDENDVVGNYGPYIQSLRKEIYQSFIKRLLIDGKAYPCFCSEDEISEIREKQISNKERIGYYGKYAKCRTLTNEEISQKILNKEPYIIRLKSMGDYNKIINCFDEIRGCIKMPENDLDIVIMKSDGLPTYHFAHLVDDYLMRTTHVIRGDEWLSSMPIHLQLFETFGFVPPKYCHISPLLKNDEGSIRKLSKRKDPESAMSYYHEKGIPKEAVMEYLATIASSEYEMWHTKNPDLAIGDYQFSFKKMNKSGALFDLDKLINISKNYISKLSGEELYVKTTEYLQKYDLEFSKIFNANKSYSISILNIERNVIKSRKDIAMYSDIKKEYDFMYDELFFTNNEYKWQKINNLEEIKNILTRYLNKYYIDTNTEEELFSNLRLLADSFGYAKEVKDYKNNPENYLGHIGDISMLLRIVLTKKERTPNLYDIMKILGKDRVLERIKKVIDYD